MLSRIALGRDPLGGRPWARPYPPATRTHTRDHPPRAGNPPMPKHARARARLGGRRGGAPAIEPPHPVLGGRLGRQQPQLPSEGGDAALHSDHSPSPTAVAAGPSAPLQPQRLIKGLFRSGRVAAHEIAHRIGRHTTRARESPDAEGAHGGVKEAPTRDEGPSLESAQRHPQQAHRKRPHTSGCKTCV